MRCAAQVLLVGGDAQAESQGAEALDGVTPPMRNVRSRVFRKQIDVDPELVSKVEFNLLTILAVSLGVAAIVQMLEWVFRLWIVYGDLKHRGYLGGRGAE